MTLPGSFPLEVFPPPLAEYAQETAESFGVSTDLVGGPMLAYLSAAIGATRSIELKAGWRELPVTWIGIVAGPGQMKTPVLKAIGRPLWRWQGEQIEAGKQALREWEADVAAWEAASKKDRGPKPEKPITSRRVVSDTTLEKLAVILEENPPGVILDADELTGWIRGLNQYKGGKGADRSHFLSMWSARSILVDRKSNQSPLYVAQPFCSIIGGLQPELLSELQDPRARDDGFIDRFLFAQPIASDRRWRDHTVPARCSLAWESTLRTLLNLQMAEYNGRAEPRVLRLSAKARHAWIRGHNEHVEDMECPDLAPVLVGPYAKSPSYAARLCLVIHMARCVADTSALPEEVDQKSVLAGWALVDYFKAHARTVYANLEETPADRAVASAVRWIRDHGGRATTRQLQKAGVASVKGRVDVDRLLALLVDRALGEIHCEKVAGGERKVFVLAEEGAA